METVIYRARIFCLMVICSVTTRAQQMITISQNASMTQNITTLNGKAGVVFVANSDDMVITTNINKDPQSPKAIKAGNLYRYEMEIDISGSSFRTFTVAKYGTTNSQKTDKVKLIPNKQLYFKIDQVENGIDLKLDPNSEMGWINGKKGMALIVFNSKIKLTINCPNLKHDPIRSGRGVAGTYLDSLIFDATQFAELAQKESILSEELETANKRMAKEAETMDDATYDALKEKIPQLTEKLNNISNQLANLLKIEVYGEKTNKMILDYNQVKGMSPMSLLRYNIVVLNETKVVLKEETFEEALAVAKKRYQEYPKHTETSYYDATREAYDKVLKHKDCPENIREAIRAERDTIASIRRNTYLMDAAEAKAEQFEKEKGFNCDEVYRYLGGVVRFADRILQYHPEITGIQTIKDNVLKRLKQHPKSMKEDGTEVVLRQRETISGTITFKNKYMAIPFEKMRVFGIDTPKIKNGKSRIIGKVNPDGTYSVVKPDNIKPLYIYVTGEKDNAHYVSDGENQLDIVVK